MSFDRTYIRWLCASLLLGAFLSLACTGQPINIFTTQTATNGGQGSGGPNASPDPNSEGSLPSGSRIAILQYGQTCPAGVTVPRNGTRECKMGCSCDYTCTPKDAKGDDLPEAVHGPTADFKVVDGAEHVNALRANFNLNVRPVSPGPFTLSCTVKGLTGVVDALVVTQASFDVEKKDGAPPPVGPPPPAAPDGQPLPPGPPR